MKKSTIAVLGGGITGLTAAYFLSRRGFTVTLFERSATLGGLAQGFKQSHWDWPLERAYHHLFKNDIDIISFAHSIGFDGIFFSAPKTDSLFKVGNNYRIFPVDSPQDFLRFPLLTPIEKLRAAAILAWLKISPALPLYEALSTEDFVKTYMGERMWSVFFEQLFRKKFGKYAENILASFMWARIHKRTKELGYIKGGFQAFIDHLEQKLKENGVNVEIGKELATIQRKGEHFIINEERFDIIVSTVPTQVLPSLTQSIFPETYISRFQKLSYLHALVLILETDKPLLDETYWLNICAEDIPLMFVGQHTHFVDKKHYGNNHIAYIGYYLERDDPRMNMTAEQLTDYVPPHLRKISRNQYKIIKSYVFRGPFAQPIFDKDFLQNKPSFITPVENFYIANLDMTYPYDRGTNYAVKLGREVAALI